MGMGKHRSSKTLGRLILPLACGLLALSAASTIAAQAGAQAGVSVPTALTTDCNPIQSTILGRSVNVCVVLPAGYEASGSNRYPTLYYLHGLFEHADSWIDKGGEDVLKGLLSDGKVGKFIVVLPDGGRSFWVNSYDGKDRYEDFFIQELVPAIDKKYRTLPVAEERGITGSSMGGYGALHLAMRHPDVFGTVSAQGAALLPKFPHPLPTEGRWGFYARVLEGPFGSPLNEAYWEANSPLTLAEDPTKFENLKIYFDCGDHDRYGFNEGAELLDKELTAKDFPHEFVLRPGDHGWDYLNQYMKFPLLFHWNYFREAEPRTRAEFAAPSAKP